MLDIAGIEVLLQQIKESAAKDDYERAHRLEDYLYRTVLRQVAEGHPDSVEMAKKALAAENVYFSRYHA